jgi:hypothetical protein
MGERSFRIRMAETRLILERRGVFRYSDYGRFRGICRGSLGMDKGTKGLLIELDHMGEFDTFAD